MLKLYTDGSYSIAKGIGGWAVVVVEDDEIKSTFHETMKRGTSNRAELWAMIVALELCRFYRKEATIYSDSKYVVNGYNSWMASWKKRKWRNTSGKTTKNSDLWDKIIKLKQKHIKVKWVKGHSGNSFNELADELAKEY